MTFAPSSPLATSLIMGPTVSVQDGSRTLVSGNVIQISKSSIPDSVMVIHKRKARVRPAFEISTGILSRSASS